MFTPSPYQQAIFDEIANGKSNLMIEAVAGSGKTTTIVEAAKLVPENYSSLFVAFNKNIVSELSVRLPPHVKAKTLHSLGYSILYQQQGYFKTNDNKVKNIYFYALHKYDSLTNAEKRELQLLAPTICQFVDLLRANCVTLKHDLMQEINKIADHFDIDRPDMYIMDEIRKVFQLTLEKRIVIDFEDMIYIPATSLQPMQVYDFIFVDEAQDLSPVQAKLITKLLAPNGRVVFVGDSSQSIYGFRGANVDSIESLTRQFNCKTLPLSICYRCSSSVVKEAKTLCPQIEPSPTAIAGSVREIEDLFSEVKPGDMVLSRTLLPLQKLVSKFIARGIPVWVDYPDLIISLGDYADKIKKLKGVLTTDEVISYQSSHIEELMRYKLVIRAAQANAKLDMLLEIMKLFPGEENILHLCNTVFSCREGVRFLSVHKAKGLETARVFILEPELFPHPNATLPWQIKQEYNLKYVAITRAKRDLMYVKTDKKERN